MTHSQSREQVLQELGYATTLIPLGVYSQNCFPILNPLNTLNEFLGCLITTIRERVAFFNLQYERVVSSDHGQSQSLRKT